MGGPGMTTEARMGVVKQVTGFDPATSHTFEVAEHFLLDGKPFEVLGGSIHYFRVHPTDWRRSLANLKAAGLNTVETYVPWNMHEPREGEFDFSGLLDLGRFLDEAAELGLWAIVRPSPFICAEWELGGLPAWLLTKRDERVRSRDPKFLAQVAAYYDRLLPQLVERQVTHGGNVLMMQVENEYGSYCNDHDYLRSIRDLMLERGVDVPLLTSDGPWRACLRAGSLIDDGVLATGNFGSRSAENLEALRAFHAEHGRTWPLMNMEFWDGWFNRWGQQVVRRPADDFAHDVRECLENGDGICLYMFHGGTNFGFMNGCSARHDHDLHQVTSYDYDAPLDEQGNPTAKWYALRDVVRDLFPGAQTGDPLEKGVVDVPAARLTGRAGLFDTLESVANPIRSQFPMPMEDLGQSYGYVLYRTWDEQDMDGEEKFRIIDGRDRAQLFMNGELKATQYQEEIGADIMATPSVPVPGKNRIDVLVENMGRVNYGPKLLADTQHKGIRTGVMADLHFLTDWEQWSLPLASADGVDWEAGWTAGQPAFYRYELTLGEGALGGDAASGADEPRDAYLDMRGFGKGCVLVNGFNVGRFWSLGPIHTLYVPHGLLHEGVNEVVVFETEGVYADELPLAPGHIIDDVEA